MGSSNLYQKNNKISEQEKAQIRVAKRGEKAHWRGFHAEVPIEQWTELTFWKIELLLAGVEEKGEQKPPGGFTFGVIERR